MECPGVAIILCSLFWWLPSLENMHWRLLCMLSRLHSSFLFSSAKHSIARTGHVYLSTHLLKGSLFISKIRHFWRKLSKHPCVASFAHFKIAFFFFLSCCCFDTFEIPITHQRCELQTLAPMLCFVFLLSRWQLWNSQFFIWKFSSSIFVVVCAFGVTVEKPLFNPRSGRFIVCSFENFSSYVKVFYPLWIVHMIVILNFS